MVACAHGLAGLSVIGGHARPGPRPRIVTAALWGRPQGCRRCAVNPCRTDAQVLHIAAFYAKMGLDTFRPPCFFMHVAIVRCARFASSWLCVRGPGALQR